MLNLTVNYSLKVCDNGRFITRILCSALSATWGMFDTTFRELGRLSPSSEWLSFYWQSSDLLFCSDAEIILKNTLRHLVVLLGRGTGPSQGPYPQRKNEYTHQIPEQDSNQRSQCMGGHCEGIITCLSPKRQASCGGASIAQRYSARLRVVWTGVESRQGLGIFLLTTVSRQALGHTQPLIQLVPGALSLGIKRAGCEADRSPPSSAELRNAWSCNSTPPIRLHGVVLSCSTGTSLLLTYLLT
jgi:hypothetical protein